MTFTHEQLQQAVQQFHPIIKLISFEQITGGISAHMYRLEIDASGTKHIWILRAHSEAERKRNPLIARMEYYLHGHIRQSGIPAPRPLHEEDNSDIFPIPFFIMDYIENDSILPASPAQPMADMLARIHQVDLKKFDYSYLPDATQRLEDNLMNTRSNPISDTLKNSVSHVKQNPPALLHGDYWSGNILWKDEKIVAVIDWEDMMRGDPLVDLGKSRLEMLWQFSEETMQNYTTHYQSMMPQLDFTYLAFWDLWGAWRLRDFASWFDDTAKVQRMQKQYDEFVNRAIDKLKVLDIL